MVAIGSERVTPLHVVASLTEGLSLRNPLMLDGLLMWSAASERQHVSPLPGEDLPEIPIPVAKEPGGRFYLCSEGFPSLDERELRYKHRRPPVQEYARLGPSKLHRVDISVGVNKSLRIPYEFTLCKRIEWWCIGDADAIRGLLARVHYLGRHRGSGKGRLDLHGTPWLVEECEAWEGFPIVRDGLPLRPLPPEWPGLEDPQLGYRVLSPPYFDHASNQLCAVPCH